MLLFPKRIMVRKKRQGLKSKTKSQQLLAQQNLESPDVQSLESEPDVQSQPVLGSQLDITIPPGHFGLSKAARQNLESPDVQSLESEPDVQSQPVLGSQLEPEIPQLRDITIPPGHFGLSTAARVTLCHLYKVFCHFAYSRPNLTDTIIFAHKPGHWWHGSYTIMNIRNPWHPSLPHGSFFINYNLPAVHWKVNSMRNYYTHVRELNKDEIRWCFYVEDGASSCCVPDDKVDVILSKNEINFRSLLNLRKLLYDS